MIGIPAVAALTLHHPAHVFLKRVFVEVVMFENSDLLLQKKPTGSLPSNVTLRNMAKALDTRKMFPVDFFLRTMSTMEPVIVIVPPLEKMAPAPVEALFFESVVPMIVTVPPFV